MNYCDLATILYPLYCAYQPGKRSPSWSRELGITGIIKLASNENPLGASSAAIAAMQEAIKTIRCIRWQGFELKDAWEALWCCALQCDFATAPTICLELAARAFLTPGDKWCIRTMPSRCMLHEPWRRPASASGDQDTAMICRDAEGRQGQQGKIVFHRQPKIDRTFLSADDCWCSCGGLPPRYW